MKRKHKQRKLNLTPILMFKPAIPFVEWNHGPKMGGKKSNPYTITLRAAKLAKKKEAYLNSA